MYARGVFSATNIFNAQTLQTAGSKFYDPIYASNPKNAQRLNRICADNELTHLRQLFCARFEWKSDTDAYPVDAIEYVLYANGLAVTFEDEHFGVLTLPCTVRTLNVYGQPAELSVIYYNHQKAPRVLVSGVDRFALLRDNTACNIPSLITMNYGRLLADVSRTAEVYQRGLKKPVIVAGNFNTKNARREFVNQLVSNEQYCILDTTALQDLGSSLSIVQNSSHNQQDLRGIHLYKQDLYNEVCQRLGIKSLSIVKKAQVTGDEINKSDTHANIILDDCYKQRRKYCEEVRKLFGLNVSVKLSSSLINDEAKNEPQEDSRD